MPCMKAYQSIAKVAEATGLSVPTLRFYEQEGLIPPVPRDGAGNRMYGEYELTRINTIRCLRAAGVTLPHMKRYFSMEGEGEDTMRVRRELLLHTQENLTKQLAELQRCMSYLSMKIEHYDAIITALSRGEQPPAFQASKFNELFAKPARADA